ncbi:hypothetical protein ACJD0Z_04190 [Flavobacteriaceae bacterium M23B6Z8]
MKKMVMIKNNWLSFIILIIVFGSCQSKEVKVSNNLKGGYTISEITYQGEDLMPNVLAPMLSFDYDSKLTFKSPIIRNEIGKFEKFNCEFLVKPKNQFLIKFDSNHSYFKDEFEPLFEVDYENRELNLILKSRLTYIKCSRILIFEDFESLKDKWGSVLN